MGVVYKAADTRLGRYQGADVDLQQAARELQVHAILTGRIVARGDTLVVKMELLDIEGDAQVWGQQYTKKLADIFVLQDEIVDEVLQALKLKLAGEPKKRSPRPTQNTEAYQLYLKGRFFRSKATPDGVGKAIELYEEAIDKDPKYALAYAGLSDCWATRGILSMKPSEAFPRAKSAAEKALALDDSLSEAHASLAACGFYYDWDWTAAEQKFQRALELRNAGYANTRRTAQARR